MRSVVVRVQQQCSRKFTKCTWHVATVVGSRIGSGSDISTISSRARTRANMTTTAIKMTRQMSSMTVPADSSSSTTGIMTQQERQNKQQQQQTKMMILSALSEMNFVSSETNWSTNPYELERHGRGESYHQPSPPDVVVSPGCVEDVSTILKYCNQNKIPVTAFGAGTSVEGHVCCLEGGISLDTQQLQNIILPGEQQQQEEEQQVIDDPIAVVGAGVTRKALNDALRHTGLQFVVDPGADATIGGMAATSASGTTAVRYGTMRDNILSLECVLADGTIIKNTGTRAPKNSAGYDLTSLMIGSEGTLGIISSVTVKLHPIPSEVMAATVVFDTLRQAANCVAMIKLSEIPVVRCELLDGPSVAAFNKWEQNKHRQQQQQQQQRDDSSPTDGESTTTTSTSVSSSTSITSIQDEKPTLFLEFQASSKISLQDQVAQTESIAINEFDGHNFRSTSDPNERKQLWSARHELYYAAINSRHIPSSASKTVVTDACVPLSKFAQVIEETARDVQQQNVVGPVFGHAGDGNFHCILPIVETDPPEYITKVHEINDRLVRRAIDAGGTATGEHGVGYGKSKYLARQYGPGAVSTMKLIKKAFDPMNILNPGKIIP